VVAVSLVRQVMVALVCRSPIDESEFAAFVAAQSDLGPKQRPRFVRVVDALPRTATHKVLKRELAADGAGEAWELRYPGV